MRTISTVFFLVAMAAPVWAGTLKEGAVVCLTSKYLTEYNRHARAGESQFMSDMLDRAQCIQKMRDEDVSEISVDNNKAHVQMQDGFKVWVNISHYQRDGETPTKDVESVDDVHAAGEDL
jgi:hypothetical protein